MQTILGSTGIIGTELAKALREYTNNIRLVSRNPKKVHEEDELFKANLLDESQVKEAIKGSDVVYLTIGFEYRYSIWKKQWPEVMHHVIDACLEENCKLVFFDNIYMYDKEALSNMTEETSCLPPSKKGRIRHAIFKMLKTAIEEKNLEALIARSADFYGPNMTRNSLLHDTLFTPLKKGKTATWLGASDKKHSFTYTIDAAKATALLGNTNDAYQQVWHLPTAPNPLTGKEWVEAVAEIFHVKAKFQTVPKWMMKIIGLFSPMMRELPEMMYQYDRDYIFHSKKFVERFDFTPTPYKEGIEAIIRADYS